MQVTRKDLHAKVNVMNVPIVRKCNALVNLVEVETKRDLGDFNIIVCCSKRGQRHLPLFRSLFLRSQSAQPDALMIFKNTYFGFTINVIGLLLDAL